MTLVEFRLGKVRKYAVKRLKAKNKFLRAQNLEKSPELSNWWDRLLSFFVYYVRMRNRW